MINTRAIILVALSATCATAQEAPSEQGMPEPPFIASAYVCEFKDGYGATSKSGEGFGSVDSVGWGGDRITFASIDLEKHTAQMIGNVGVSNVLAIRGGNNLLSFVEMTPAGAVNVTSLLLPALAFAPAPAVHSRHVVIADFLVSQFVGSCEPEI